MEMKINVPIDIEVLQAAINEWQTKTENVDFNKQCMAIARAEMGVREKPGAMDNQRIVEYHKAASINNDKGQPDSVPWCSSFVCWVVERAGGKSTNSRAARSWLSWGQSSRSNPKEGDIVIFWRGSESSWQGHVAFFIRFEGNSVVCLGGNQSDEVNISYYDKKRLLDIRRHS